MNNNSIDNDRHGAVKKDSNIRKHKPIPFLELSSSNLSNLNQDSIDFENVLSVWTGLTKSSSYVINGKRLENISWRVINRNLVNPKKSLQLTENDFNTLINISTSKTTRQPFLDEAVHGHHHQVQAHAKTTKKRFSPARFSSNSNNNNGNHHGATASSPAGSPSPVPKRPTNPRQVSEISIQKFGTEITEEVSSSDEEAHQVPKGHDIANEDEEDDLKFHQPEPKFVSELFNRSSSALDASNSSNEEVDKTGPKKFYEDEDLEKIKKINDELQNEKPPMLRTNTSTSVVRGFDPSHVSISYVNIQDAKQKQQQQQQQQQRQQQQKRQDSVEEKLPHVSSLFGNSKPRRESESISPQAVSSLFSNTNREQTHTKDITPPSEFHRAATTSVSSLFNSRDKQKSPVQQQHAAHPNHVKQNLLNHLGMTSLHADGKLVTNGEQSEKPKDPNNMFFIESSPSPAESDIVGSIDNITLKAAVERTQEGERLHHPHHAHAHHHHHHSSGSGGSAITHPNHVSSFSHTGEQGDSERHDPNEESTLHSIHQQSNTSLFQHQNRPKQQLIYSSDSYSDDSEWSSMSDDSGSDVDEPSHRREDDRSREQRWREESVNFIKKDENGKKPHIKRSLLSGLFLNEMGHEVASDTGKPVLLRSNTTSDLNNPKLRQQQQQQQQQAAAQQHVIESKSSLEISHQRKSSSVTPSQTNINALASVTSPPTQVMKPRLERQSSNSSVISANKTASIYGSSLDKKQQQSSLTKLMSKSALNLTSYFMNSRRPSSVTNNNNTITNGNLNNGATHGQSNAPPTASTLLPTALATHMFLPNVHQRARSKLSAVVETRDDLSSSDASGSNPVQQFDKPSLPTMIPLKSRTSSFVSVKDTAEISPKINHHAHHHHGNHRTKHRGSNDFDPNKVIPGEKLSPRLSRKLMLATELSESLRTSMIWDRKMTQVQLKDGYDKDLTNDKYQRQNGDAAIVPDGRGREEEDEDEDEDEDEPVEVPNLDNSSISDIEDVDKKNLMGVTHAEQANNSAKNNDGEEWDDTDELDYHTKGW